MMRIFLSKPHMGGAEHHYVEQAFQSNFIAPLGPQLDSFEENFENYLGERVHCVGLSSGTAALHVALHMENLQKDDEVWVSSMTFAGGVFPILYEQAIPVFFDLCPKSWTISPDILEEQLEFANRANRLPKVIIPTDLYGQSCDLDRLESLARRFGVSLIIDSAESAGAQYKNRPAGAGGDCSILSFNGNKIITTGGGGMLVSRDQSKIEKARFYATQAKENAPHYEHRVYGYNYRMGNIPAAIGIGQLEVLDERVDRRREIFTRYKNALGDIDGVNFMPEPEWSRSSHWLTTATFDSGKLGVNREDIREKLLQHKIESRPMWKPMHQQPLFEGSQYHGSGLDEMIFRDGLCLPSGSDMSEAEQNEVIEVILSLIGEVEKDVY